MYSAYSHIPGLIPNALPELLHAPTGHIMRRNKQKDRTLTFNLQQILPDKAT